MCEEIKVPKNKNRKKVYSESSNRRNLKIEKPPIKYPNFW